MADQQIRFHNTLTGKKEIFIPLEPGKIKMYVCGITPYDESHLGHARCYVFFDTVLRFFKAAGFQVLHIQNFTDVDDKIIAKANKLGMDPKAVADKYIQDYNEKMAQLNVLPADQYPRVTETMPEIIKFIEELVKNGAAYSMNGDVYFRVRFIKEYGKLSKRTLEDMQAGSRVEVNDSKEDPMDFALWKTAKAGEPSWESPWGLGRPGWHIECSVMSMKFLGETFDIHGGGQDLIFPHHENEIAQSEAFSGKMISRYWLHNGFVTVNREKMSKSLGNFFSLGEIFSRVPPEVVRFFLLSRHYKSPLDFSDDLLEQSRSAFGSLQEINDICFFIFGEDVPTQDMEPEHREHFMAALSDDFNTEKAIAILFQIRSEMADAVKKKDLESLKRKWKTLRHLCGDILGIPLVPRMTLGQVQKFKMKLSEREGARKNKDWAKADAIRKELEAQGFLVEDTPLGSLVKAHG